MDVKVKVSINTWVTDPGDSSDEPYTQRASTDGTYDVVKVSCGMGEGWDWEHTPVPSNESFVPGDKVYVVWADYQSGDTFGRSGGHGTVLIVTKRYHLAQNVKEWAKDDEQFPWPKEAGDSQPYRSWEGYFEHLNDIKLELFLMQP